VLFVESTNFVSMIMMIMITYDNYHYVVMISLEYIIDELTAGKYLSNSDLSIHTNSTYCE